MDKKQYEILKILKILENGKLIGKRVYAHKEEQI